jgi:hypothetical protein
MHVRPFLKPALLTLFFTVWRRARPSAVRGSAVAGPRKRNLARFEAFFEPTAFENAGDLADAA